MLLCIKERKKCMVEIEKGKIWSDCTCDKMYTIHEKQGCVRKTWDRYVARSFVTKK